jgi:A/G-specific adenine glycosylase
MQDLVDALGLWYDHAARDLPWRRTRDPYAIWVSEVMLQQTRVETVVPYYQRFLRSFPSVGALAAASQEDVLHHWSGLGYYRRARQLHLAAAEVVERYAGELPRDVSQLRTLSGVGEYTAGAIASIAFGKRAALVDGNVARVLSRLFGIEDDMATARGRKRVWSVVRELVPRDRPGRFNQALMELGATVCAPKRPRCDACPVARHCRAHLDGRVHELPRMAARKAPRTERFDAMVVSHRGALLLAQREDDGRFGSLWEPPLVAKDAGGRAAAMGDLGGLAFEPCGSVSHVLSHRRLEIDVARATAATRWRLPRAEAPYQRLKWAAPNELPLSTLARKLLRKAGVVLALWLALIALARPAQAADKPADRDEAVLDKEELALYQRESKPRGIYARIFPTVSFGRGFRFNNPFRLRTQLGDTAESVSLTAPYVDLGVGVGFGNPFGVQHGPNVHASFAVSGVSQQAIALSYMALYRGSSPVTGYARGGISILTAPDANVGGELALGFAAFFTGSLGVTAEVIGDLFYGAGTFEKKFTAVPILSLQLGLIYDFEVLP